MSIWPSILCRLNPVISEPANKVSPGSEDLPAGFDTGHPSQPFEVTRAFPVPLSRRLFRVPALTTPVRERHRRDEFDLLLRLEARQFTDEDTQP